MYQITNPEAQARHILDEFSRCTPSDVSPGLDLFSPDGKFFAISNSQAGCLSGHDEMRAGFRKLFDEIRAIEYELRTVAVAGNTLFLERVERFVYKGRRVEGLMACGVAVLGDDGLLVEFRDYYDSAVLEAGVVGLETGVAGSETGV